MQIAKNLKIAIEVEWITLKKNLFEKGYPSISSVSIQIFSFVCMCPDLSDQ
jgi:hypothetical protein